MAKRSPYNRRFEPNAERDFADYGLVFKSEKWSEYFDLLPWYEGKYENVDHLLSPIDKENIKVILAVKKQLLKNEESSVNRREILYETIP